MLWCCCGTPPTSCENQAAFYDPFDDFPLFDAGEGTYREWRYLQTILPPISLGFRDRIYADNGRMLVQPELLYSFEFPYKWTCGIRRCFKAQGSPDEIIPSVGQWWTLSVRFSDQGEFLETGWSWVVPTANFAGLLGRFVETAAGDAHFPWRSAVGMAAARNYEVFGEPNSGPGTWWVCDPRITTWDGHANPLFNYIDTSEAISDGDLTEQTLEYTATGYKITYKLNGSTIHTVGPDSSIQWMIDNAISPDGERLNIGAWSILGCQANRAAYDEWNYTSSFM